MTPNSLNKVLEKYLFKSEEILWLGKPEVMRVFDPKDKG